MGTINRKSIYLNSKNVGDISEAYVIAKFLKLGYVVLKPFGDNQRYDLVIDRGNGFERVQVKTANFKQDHFTFECCSSYAHRGGVRRQYNGDIELFAVYCSELDSVYIVPIEDGTNTAKVLRLTEPKTNKKKAAMADSYKV